MRQFWSMRSNKGRHRAQTLRFETPPKRGIIAREHLLNVANADPLSGGWQRLEVRKSRSPGTILYTGLDRRSPSGKKCSMAETVVTLRLNQQQLELLDRTIAQGVAPDRVSLVRLALREYAGARKSDGTSR
jgi:hypothetical protein